LRAADVPGEVRTVSTLTADRLEDGLDGGAVYTDDRAPVEWLVDSSLLEYAND
jgi:hypothetical protein